MYHEDGRTGSIYAMRELIAVAERGRIPLEILLRGLNPLPYSAAQLGVSERTLHRRISAGKLASRTVSSNIAAPEIA